MPLRIPNTTLVLALQNYNGWNRFRLSNTVWPYIKCLSESTTIDKIIIGTQPRKMIAMRNHQFQLIIMSFDVLIYYIMKKPLREISNGNPAR